VYSHITKIPGVCGGRPAIDHTRVRVLNIVYLLKEGYRPERMLEQYSDLNLAQVHAALAYTTTTRMRATSRKTKPGTRGTSAIRPSF